MESPNRYPSGIFIVADESATWRCAGLRQIDRLVLALNEWIGLNGIAPVPVWIEKTVGASTLPAPGRPLSNLDFFRDRAAFCRDMSITNGLVLILSTRLIIGRGDGIQIFNRWMHQSDGPACVVFAGEFCDAIAKQSLPAIIDRLRESKTRARLSGVEENWRYLRNKKDIRACETFLLRGSVKPQDGVIAQLINRPISRAISRLLVRAPISPNEWTVLIMALPLVGAMFLARGNYVGFAIGAVLFELHSALDGCDGEIARVKYLESGIGSTLDEICDRVSTLIYALGLGAGLFHQVAASPALRWFYPMEAVFAALTIGIGESILTRMPLHHGTDDELYSDYAARNQQSFNRGDHLKLWVIRHSKMLFLSERATLFFAHVTKRDVFNFIFLLLALFGWPSLILHTLAVTAVIILVLAVKKLLQPRLSMNRASVEID